MNDTTVYAIIDEFLASISQVRLVEASSVVDFCLDIRQIVSSLDTEDRRNVDFMGV